MSNIPKNIVNEIIHRIHWKYIPAIYSIPGSLNQNLIDQIRIDLNQAVDGGHDVLIEDIKELLDDAESKLLR